MIFCSEEELNAIIQNYRPDIMVVGSDYRNKKVVGSQNAGLLKFFDKIDGFSTTKTIKDIDNRR